MLHYCVNSSHDEDHYLYQKIELYPHLTDDIFVSLKWKYFMILQRAIVAWVIKSTYGQMDA